MRRGLRLKHAVRRALLGVGKECSKKLVDRIFDLSVSLSSKHSLKSSGFGRQSVAELFEEAVGERVQEIHQLLSSIQNKNKTRLTELTFNSAIFCFQSTTTIAEQLIDMSDYLSCYESFGSTATSLNQQKESLEAGIASKDLELIRYVMLALNGALDPEKERVCQFCFRVITQRKSCRQHLATESIAESGSAGNAERNRAKKILEIMDPEAKRLLDRFKAQRKILGDNVLVLNNNEIQKVQSLELRKGAPIDDYTYKLIRSVKTESWEDVKQKVLSKMKQDSPHVFREIKAEAYQNCSNFQEFVRSVYSKNCLDNPMDSSLDPYWFFRTIIIAEIWYIGERLTPNTDERFKDNEERDNRVIKLHEQSGNSYSEIGQMIGLSKSAVAKIIKNYRENQMTRADEDI